MSAPARTAARARAVVRARGSIAWSSGTSRASRSAGASPGSSRRASLGRRRSTARPQRRRSWRLRSSASASSASRATMSVPQRVRPTLSRSAAAASSAAKAGIVTSALQPQLQQRLLGRRGLGDWAPASRRLRMRFPGRSGRARTAPRSGREPAPARRWPARSLRRRSRRHRLHWCCAATQNLPAPALPGQVVTVGGSASTLSAQRWGSRRRNASGPVLPDCKRERSSPASA